MRGLILQVADLDAGALEEWRSLATRAAEPNPFFEADFVLAAARHLRQPTGSVLIAFDDGGWRGCLPVHTSACWRGAPGRWLVASRHDYAFLGTPLLEASAERLAFDAMLGAADRWGPGALVLEWLGRDGPVAAALEASCLARGMTAYEEFNRAAIARRAEPTYFEYLNARRRKELRRLARRLEDEVGAAAKAVDRANDGAAVGSFLALEASGWKGRAGTAMASDAAHARFFHDVCTAFAAAGRLDLLALEAADHTLAMQCNLLADGCLFGFKVAHDETYARYSPGVQLELAAVKRFHARDDAHRMDSCTDPDNELMNRLWPDRLRLTTLAVPLGTSILRPTVRGALRLHRRLRRCSTSGA